MLDKNLLTLEEYYPEIYNHIKSLDFPYEEGKDLSLVGINGYLNCKIKTSDADLYLHSSYNPYNEAAKWMESINSNLNMYVIIGGGFYYHIDYLLSKHPDKKILIIEPSYDIFYQSLNNIDLTSHLKNSNVLFLVSQDIMNMSILLAQILVAKGIGEFEISCLPSYRQLFREFCIEMEQAIFNMIKTLRANIGTEYVHSRNWVYNTFRNLRKTNIDSVPLESLFNQFQGLPALIVSAGPSLGKQIELLKENQDKFLIIAAGSAVNVLERNFITPHMVVALDSEEVQDNIFKNIQDNRITLAYGHSLRYSSLEYFQGKKYWFRGNADSIVDFYEDSVGIKTENIEIGPSCANEAMDIARRLGCSPLVFIGQDLAYTNDELYSKGVVHATNMATDIGDRIIKIDMFGNEIVTKTAFLVMKTYFENYIKSHNAVEYINCTEGGLEIIGMQHRTFKELIDKLPEVNADLFDDINKKYNNTKNVINEIGYLERNNEFFSSVERETEDITEKSKNRLMKVQQLLAKLSDITVQEIQEHMDEIIEITNEIETTRLHNGVFHSICAAYFLSLRQYSYNKLEEIDDKREKYRLLIEGIEKQYLYYEVILQSLKDTLSDGNQDREEA